MGGSKGRSPPSRVEIRGGSKGEDIRLRVSESRGWLKRGDFRLARRNPRRGWLKGHFRRFFNETPPRMFAQAAWPGNSGHCPKCQTAASYPEVFTTESFRYTKLRSSYSPYERFVPLLPLCRFWGGFSASTLHPEGRCWHPGKTENGSPIEILTFTLGTSSTKMA